MENHELTLPCREISRKQGGRREAAPVTVYVVTKAMPVANNSRHQLPRHPARRDFVIGIARRRENFASRQRWHPMRPSAARAVKYKHFSADALILARHRRSKMRRRRRARINMSCDKQTGMKTSISSPCDLTCAY